MNADTISTLISIAQVAVAPVLALFYRSYIAQGKIAEDTARSLLDFKLHCAETYSTKNDLGKAIEQFSRSIDAVFAKLERIEDKLDHKQDKV